MKELILLIIYCIFLAGINLFAKIYPRRNIKMYGDDSWGVMLWAKYFRSGLDKESFSNFLISGEKFYGPDFLSVFLSAFKPNFVLRFNRLFSPLFDSLNLALVFSVSQLLFSNILLTTVACVIYMVFPPFIFQSSFLSARSLGYLFFNYSLVSAIFAVNSSCGIVCLISAVIFGALLFNTHKFSAQAFIFVILGLFAKERSFLYIYILLFSLLGALIISKGFYFRLLLGHIKTIKLHFKTLFSSPFEKVSLNHALAKALFWASVLALIILGNLSGNWQPLSASFLFWAMTLFVVFIASTFIVFLRPFGQGYRYMEYALFPFSILFASVVFSKTLASFFAITGFALYLLFAVKTIRAHFRAIENDYINIIDDARLRIFNFIRSSRIERVFCIPFGMSQACAYFTGKKVLWTYYDWDNFMWLFRNLRLPFNFSLSCVFEKYQLDAILLNTKFAKIEDLKFDCIVVHQENEYLLLAENKK